MAGDVFIVRLDLHPVRLLILMLMLVAPHGMTRLLVK